MGLSRRETWSLYHHLKGIRGKMGSPYRNSRQSYSHGLGWSWNCGWSSINLISGSGRHRPLATLGLPACTGHVIPGRTGREAQGLALAAW